jgi:translation initiation factor IF-2
VTQAPSQAGTVVEGNLDPKRGNTATIIIKNGTLRSGEFVVSGTSFAPVRIMEDATGKATQRSESLSEPVGIVGWNNIPKAGAAFYTVTSKKEAEASYR